MYTSGFKNMRSDKRHRHAFEVYAHLPKQGISPAKLRIYFKTTKESTKYFHFPTCAWSQEATERN